MIDAAWKPRLAEIDFQRFGVVGRRNMDRAGLNQAGNRVGAYNWAYTKETFAHAPDEIDQACERLGITDAGALKSALEELKAELETKTE